MLLVRASRETAPAVALVGIGRRAISAASDGVAIRTVLAPARLTGARNRAQPAGDGTTRN